MESKNIECFGCYFRSHLEARWYLFWDELGFPVKYEEETYSLPNGMAYLPDFKIFGYHGSYLWAEVKGVNNIQELKAKEVDYAKIRLFHEMGHPIIVLPSVPDNVDEWINMRVTSFYFVNGISEPSIPYRTTSGELNLARSYMNRSPEMDRVNEALHKAKTIRW